MKFIDIFHEGEKKKNKWTGSKYSTNGVETHVGSSGGTYVFGKTFVIKMKFVKKRPVQTHEYKSEADED